MICLLIKKLYKYLVLMKPSKCTFSECEVSLHFMKRRKERSSPTPVGYLSDLYNVSSPTWWMGVQFMPSTRFYIPSRLLSSGCACCFFNKNVLSHHLIQAFSDTILIDNLLHHFNSPHPSAL